VSLVGFVLDAVVVAGIGVLAVSVVVEAYIILRGGRALGLAARRHSPVEDEVAMASPLTAALSIVVPWCGANPGERLAPLRSLRYPELEVIVVCTPGRAITELVDAFDLVEIPVVFPAEGPGDGVRTRAYVPQDGTSLLVVEHPGPADESELANVGAGLARARAVTVLHPGVLLTDNTLLRMARPFRDQPRSTVATTTVARPLDAAVVEHERVVDRCWPRRWSARVELVRELRTSVLPHAAGFGGPDGLGEVGGLVLIRRDQMHEVGGYRPGARADDADLLRRAQRMQAVSRRDARVVTAVAAPVAWREVGSGRRTGGGRALGVGHRAFGLTLVVAAAAGLVGLGLGETPAGLVALLAVVGVLLPATLGIAALAIDELAFPRRGSLGDLLAGVAAAAIEPFRLWRPWRSIPPPSPLRSPTD
jgi:hypothetical protein